MMGWLMNDKLLNLGTVLSYAWRDWGKPQKASVRIESAVLPLHNPLDLWILIAYTEFPNAEVYSSERIMIDNLFYVLF
jgi:hypothetical protein